MNLKPFGQIDIENLQDCYSGALTVGGSTIAVDLNFDEQTINPDRMAKVAEFITNIEHHLKTAHQAIADDYELGEASQAAGCYLEHHLAEMYDDEIKSLFGTGEVTKALYLSKLNITRVGLYPEEDEAFVVVDIQFSPDITDYLMAVTFDDELALVDIAMES